MSVPPEVGEILRQWIRKAENDLEAARRIMADEAGCPYDTACFHCQPAVEKYLKGLLTLLNIQAPRTHDVQQLAELLPAEKRLAVTAGELGAMNPYAVDVRYADDWRAPQRTDALRAMELAERTRAEIRKLLPSEVLG